MTQSQADSLARATAIALADQTLRDQLRNDFRDSPFPLHALDLRSYLQGVSGHRLASAAAQALDMSPGDFLAFVQSLPDLTLTLERVYDRVSWDGNVRPVVYASPLPLETLVRKSPSTTGFTAQGDPTEVPLLDADHVPYISILPTSTSFGATPEQTRAAAPKHVRQTVSTRDEELARTIFPQHGQRAQNTVTPMTIVPNPCDTDPTCNPGPSDPGESDGISLATQFTGGYCFGTPGWGSPLDASNDRDHDGIRDDCEFALALAFQPMLARNSHDNSPEKEPYWSVKRIAGTASGIAIFYALSYYRDGGFPNLGGASGHDGDSEFLILQVHNNINQYNYHMWSLDQATLSAHWNSAYDNTATYAASDLEYPSTYRGRPRIWVSRDKHANYRSKSVCNSVEYFGYCDNAFTGTVYDDLEVLTTANLGNYWDQGGGDDSRKLLNACFTSRHPGTGGAGYGLECYWQSFPDFTGWHGSSSGSTPYGVLLQFYGF